MHLRADRSVRAPGQCVIIRNGGREHATGHWTLSPSCHRPPPTPPPRAHLTPHGQPGTVFSEAAQPAVCNYIQMDDNHLLLREIRTLICLDFFFFHLALSLRLFIIYSLSLWDCLDGREKERKNSTGRSTGERRHVNVLAVLVCTTTRNLLLERRRQTRGKPHRRILQRCATKTIKSSFV